MASKQLKVTVEFEPFELADMFWQLDSDEQAKFFNRLGIIASHKLCFQMCNVSQSEELQPCGKDAIEIIGSYAESKG